MFYFTVAMFLLIWVECVFFLNQNKGDKEQDEKKNVILNHEVVQKVVCVDANENFDFKMSFHWIVSRSPWCQILSNNIFFYQTVVFGTTIQKLYIQAYKKIRWVSTAFVGVPLPQINCFIKNKISQV